MNRQHVEVRVPIKLGQFLKLANVVDSGVEAAAAISGGFVFVDGVEETRRGRQLLGGEVVRVEAEPPIELVVEAL